MEAFSLLKYWRVGGGNNVGGVGGGGVGSVGDSGANVRNGTTTIVTAVTPNTTETDDDDDDDGPFFDLEFAVPDEEEEEEDDDADGGDANSNANSNRAQNGSNCENESEEDDDNEEEEEEEDQDDESDVGVGEREFKFTLSSGSSDDRTDPNLSLSPSDDLFFKGRLVPIESSSLVFNPSESEPNSKPQFPVSLLKSATKFRVFMLGLKKSKPNTTEKPDSNGSVPAAASKQQQNKQEETQHKQPEEQEKQEAPQQQQSKFFTVKFKVEEVPIVSLFTRDNSRSASGNNKAQKQSIEESASDEKRFSKDMMQKYLKKVKPLYVRVSKRYGEKLRFSGQLSLGAGAKAAPPAEIPAPVKTAAEKNQAEPPEATAPAPEGSVSNVKSQKLTNFPTGLRVVCKHLGKSRSASSAVAAAPPGPVASKRRDDSLLQQQDGIQGAIMHCKRSFHASRDSDSSLLSRSVSDPSREKCSELLLLSRKSSDEGKGGRSCS